jgi:hypothetical protein
MASRGRSSGSPRVARRAPRARAPPAPPPEPERRSSLAPIAASRPVQALAARPDLAAALLIALPVLVYLGPLLVGAKVFAATGMLFAGPPFEVEMPPDLVNWINDILVDIGLADYPWRAYARELLHEGVFPAWNPHAFAGVPFFSNPQTGLFTPFNLPLWLLPLDYGLGLSAALKLWAGGFGVYLLARQLRLGFLPGLLGGVAFSFSALNIVWLTHETLPGVVVMLPWMVWLVERIFERGRLGDMLWLAVATAVALGGGHPGMQVHVMVAVGFYVLLRLAFVREHATGEQLRATAFAFGGMLLGALLMAVMLIPEALSTHETIGTVARKGGQGTLPGSTMPIDTITTVLFPDWWGRPTGIEVEPALEHPGTLVNYNERTFYAGIVALLLACVGLLGREGWRRKAPFVLLGAGGLATALHAPVLYWLATHLPVLEQVQSQRLHFLFAFAVAVLAAFGLDAVLKRPEGERLRAVVPLVAIGVGLIALGFADIQPGDVGHVVDHFLTGTDHEGGGVLALTSIAWLVIFAVGVGIALWGAIRWPHHRVALVALVVALAALDSLHFATNYQPMQPREKAIPTATPAVEYLQERVDEGRFVALETIMAPSSGMLYGLRDVRGYEPPYPTLRFFRLWRTANPTQRDWQPHLIEGLSPSGLSVLSVLGARFMMAGPGTAPPNLREEPWMAPMKRVYSGQDATVFRNDMAVPRAMVARRVQMTVDEDETRATLVAEGFDPRETVVVERDQPGIAELASQPVVRGTAKIAEEENSRVTLDADLDRRGLVVLNDSLVDGWSVRVDGEEATALRVNDVMRGVVVGAGRHQIEWSYKVAGLRAGALVSLLALAALLGGAVLLRLRARR